MNVKFVVDEYIGTFYKQDTLGRWRIIGTVGNSGVAWDFVDIIERLGHKVKVVETVSEAV